MLTSWTGAQLVDRRETPALEGLGTATRVAQKRRVRSRFRPRVESRVDNPLVHPGKAHLVGIQGAGMQSLAVVLAESGWRVTGSDRLPSTSSVGQGGAAGIVGEYCGHAAWQLPDDADLLIYSSAVAEANVERRAAVRRGIPQLSYPQMLGRLQAGSIGVAVAGTHGKSTTTAMLTRILIEAGADPTAIFGAAPLGAACGGRRGAGEHVVVEACEYQRNFLALQPRAAALLNVEWDHCDTYADLAAVQSAFTQFAALIPSDGLLVVNRDCSNARTSCTKSAAPLVTFGVLAGADWLGGGLRPLRGRYQFQIWRRGRRVTELVLSVPGLHNVYNALAAAALAGELGASAAAIRRGLEQYSGLQRRCETLGTFGGVTLVDDYAHHPSEVRATLAAVRQQYPGRRLWCVFQPHQAARTAALLDEFAASLHNADAVLVADIYRAREDSSTPAVTSADLVSRIRRGPQVAASLPTHDSLVDRLRVDCRAGDVVVACGAGDIGKVLHELCHRF